MTHFVYRSLRTPALALVGAFAFCSLNVANAKTFSAPEIQALPGHRVVMHGEWSFARGQHLVQALNRVRAKLPVEPLIHDACFDEIAFQVGLKFGVEDRSRMNQDFSHNYRKILVTIDENASVNDMVNYLNSVLPPLRVPPEPTRWEKVRSLCVDFLL